LSILATEINAGISSSVTGGARYDSNLQYKDLHSVLLGLYLENIDGYIINTDGSVSLSYEGENVYTFHYSICSDMALNDQRFSRLDNYLESSASISLSEKTYFDIAFGFHNFLENYREPDYLFNEFYGKGDFFYDINYRVTIFASLKGGYYKSRDDISRVKYLTGPYVDFELGGYFYPEENDSFIKVTSGLQIYDFKDEVTHIKRDFGDRQTIGISNEFLKNYYNFFLEYSFKPVLFSLEIKYAYLRWFKRSKYSTLEKRRIDHMIDFLPAVIWNYSERLRVKVYNNFRKNFSNMGEDKRDYIDYNYTQLIAGVSVTYGF